MLGPCFVMQYFVSCVVLQIARWGRESRYPYFYCVLNGMWLLLFFAPSTRCCVIVCSLKLWHFLNIHTHLLFILVFEHGYINEGFLFFND